MFSCFSRPQLADICVSRKLGCNVSRPSFKHSNRPQAQTGMISLLGASSSVLAKTRLTRTFSCPSPRPDDIPSLGFLAPGFCGLNFEIFGIGTCYGVVESSGCEIFRVVSWLAWRSPFATHHFDPLRIQAGQTTSSAERGAIEKS